MKRVLTALVESGRAVITEMIRLEVMAGARSIQEFGGFRADLEAIPCLATTFREWHQAEEMSFALSRAGRRVAAADTLISAVAISYRVPLWHADGDFERVRKTVSGFQTIWYPKHSPSV